ncbi:hypothetical protein D3C83_248660 [compost metagenome]
MTGIVIFIFCGRGKDHETLLRKCRPVEEKRLANPSPPNALVGGPVRIPPGFPLKACGNDAMLGN